MIWFLLVAALAVIAGLVFAISFESSLIPKPTLVPKTTKPVRTRTLGAP